MSRVGPEPGERLDTSLHGRVRTGRVAGSALIAVAAWLLALIGGGALFVSFSAQYAYILAARRQDAASVNTIISRSSSSASITLAASWRRTARI